MAPFGRRRQAAEEAYRDFVSAGREKLSIWEQLQQRVYLGSVAFICGVHQRRPVRQDLSEIPWAHSRAPTKPLAAYARGRGNPTASMRHAFASWGYTMKEIAAHFGVHDSTVSRAVKAHEDS